MRILKAKKSAFTNPKITMNFKSKERRYTQGILIVAMLLCSVVFVKAHEPKPEEVVAFACGFAGQPSDAVVKVSRLVQARQYGKVSQLLNSGNNAEKFLAVVAIERLVFKGRYQIDAAERKQIEMIKTSNKKVSVCSGCTYFDEISLSDMFREVDYLGSSRWIASLVK